MKFTALTSLAALAAVVSGAAIKRRGEELPARFTLEIVSDDPVVGGLHVRYAGGEGFTFLSPSPDAIFLGQGTRVVLDYNVFPITDTQFDHGGQRELSVFLNGIFPIGVESAEMQADFAAHKVPLIADYMVMDGMLHPIAADGSMVKLQWHGCGDLENVPDQGQDDVILVWNAMPYEIDCPYVQLKVVEVL